MLDIGREIENLLNECSESVAEIARRSHIDRSTLYKIVNGQRLPTAEQLDALMHSLRVTPGQRRTLLECAEALRLGPDEQRQNAQTEELLGVLLNADRAVKSPPPARKFCVLTKFCMILRPFQACCTGFCAGTPGIPPNSP